MRDYDTHMLYRDGNGNGSGVIIDTHMGDFEARKYMITVTVTVFLLSGNAENINCVCGGAKYTTV